MLMSDVVGSLNALKKSTDEERYNPHQRWLFNAELDNLRARLLRLSSIVVAKENEQPGQGSPQLPGAGGSSPPPSGGGGKGSRGGGASGPEDRRMPGNQGVWLLEKARQIQPRIIRILATAYADPEEGRRSIRARQLTGELGLPEDIAYAALYLASDESKYMAGSGFVIDGGMTAGKS